METMIKFRELFAKICENLDGGGGRRGEIVDDREREADQLRVAWMPCLLNRQGKHGKGEREIK